MKTYVLIISKHFPKTHKLSGEPTYFAEKIKENIKLHTIRGNYYYWVNIIKEVIQGRAVLSVREWSDKPYRSKQIELFRLTEKDGIGIEILRFYIDKDGIPSIKYPIVDNNAEPSIETISQNDGLDFDDFKEWFKGYNLRESLVIIHFTGFRYYRHNSKVRNK